MPTVSTRRLTWKRPTKSTRTQKHGQRSLNWDLFLSRNTNRKRVQIIRLVISNTCYSNYPHNVQQSNKMVQSWFPSGKSVILVPGLKEDDTDPVASICILIWRNFHTEIQNTYPTSIISNTNISQPFKCPLNSFVQIGNTFILSDWRFLKTISRRDMRKLDGIRLFQICKTDTILI